MADKIYCYPGSNVLKNKLGIKDKERLLSAEIMLTGTRLHELQGNPIHGNFDFKHLCRIHHHIFKDLYGWAGKPRTVDISKGNLFCLTQHIQGYAASIFEKFAPECMAQKDDKNSFVKTLAKYYADLNALHPFREGNGRTQREFTRELCLKCGYTFDLIHTSHEEMLAASMRSFDYGDSSGLEAIFRKAVEQCDTVKETEL